jgi:hypothetical protein
MRLTEVKWLLKLRRQYPRTEVVVSTEVLFYLNVYGIMPWLKGALC